MFRTRGRRWAAGLLVVAVLAVVAVRALSPSSGDSPAEPEMALGPVETRAQPWAERPVVELAFDVAADLGSVSGRETVVFTPDAEVCELVFRLWANKPTAARDGTSMVLTDAAVDGAPVTPQLRSAGAPEGAPGTLAELPLPGCVPAGTELRAELGFTVQLGENAGERVGHSPQDELAWFATAFPLLAWVREEGWVRDPAVNLFGETVTSEDFRVQDLSVTAPGEYRVLASGTPAGTRPGPTAGTTTHSFTAEALRDLTVSVGRFDVVERQVGDVTLRVGTPTSGSRVDAEGWTDALATSLGDLEALLGPYPYPDLSATIIPALQDGIEFPAALQFGDVDRSTVPALVAHELAHMWFYSLVGNNQAQNPWIDEAFATYAQAMTADQQSSYQLSDVGGQVAGYLGQPMEYWAEQGNFGRYVRGVYSQGAAVLLAARDRAGPDRFDAAVRAYIDTSAHRVVDRSDVEVAFRDVPELLDLLREYGALPAP